MINSCLEVYNENDTAGGAFTPPVCRNAIAEYNQTILGDQRFCVPTAAMTAISKTTGYRFTKADFQSIKELVNTYGREEGTGMGVGVGSNALVERYNNKFPNNPIYNYSIKINSSELLKFTLAGYLVHTGYNTTKEWSLDSQDNGVLDTIPVGKKLYGHSINIGNKSGNIIVDNYIDKKKYNTYSVKDLNGCIKEGMFFGYGYVYLYVNEQTQMNTIPCIKAKNQNEQNIIDAWKQEVGNDEVSFKNYIDEYAITRMLIDLARVRNV